MPSVNSSEINGFNWHYVKFDVPNQCFDEEENDTNISEDENFKWIWPPKLIKQNENVFLVHLQNLSIRETTKLLVQMVGSATECQKFTYWSRVKDSKIGLFYYEGPVKSLNDDKNEIMESGLCFNIPYEALKSILEDNWFTVEIGIREMKSQETSGKPRIYRFQSTEK